MHLLSRVLATLFPANAAFVVTGVTDGMFAVTGCRYEVRKKSPKTVIDDITTLLGERFTGNDRRIQSGIVYCLSKKECEDVASKLSRVKQRNGRKLSIRCGK